MDFVICRLFTRLPPVLQLICHGCVFMNEIWCIFYILFSKNCLFVKKKCCEGRPCLFLLSQIHKVDELPHSSLMKDKKEKIRQMNFHCTVYTGTTWNDFAELHQLRTMNARGHINSVPWMTAVTSTPYHEWTLSHYLRTVNECGLTNSVPWMHAVCRLRKATFIKTNCVHSWYGVGVTAFIHGTEFMRFGKVALGSTKISKKWLWPVKVTLEVIKRHTIVFCWSCDDGHLKWDKKFFLASSLQIQIE